MKRKIMLHFENFEKIGKGTYGVVYKAIDNVKARVVAIKKIYLEKDYGGIPSTIIREISILKELNHYNIVKLFEVFYQDKRYYLVFEYSDFDLKHLIETKTFFIKNNRLINFIFIKFLL